MKIVKLKAKNIKKLKDVEIKPNQNLVLVTGKNRNGKTSVLDCILYALGGKSAIPDEPIRNGEDKGEITLDLGEYTVHRTFTENGTYLEVKNKDGLKFTKQQSILDDMVNKLYFDPLEFLKKNGKEQKEALLKALGVDLSEERQDYKEAYQERTLVGRERKKAKAKLDDLPKPPKGVEKKEKVDVFKLADAINDTKEEIKEYNSLDGEIEEKRTNVGDLKIKIEKLKEQLSNEKDELNQLEIKKETIDVDSKQERLKELEEKKNNAQKINEEIDNANKYYELEKEYENTDEKYKELNLKLEEITVKKSMKLREANMPEGVDVTQDGLSYNGLPLEQASGQEGLTLSLKIAMMMAGKLQVIRITDGSLLDSDNLKAVEDLAEEKDFQVWLEYVKDENDGVGIYLEDGEIKERS